VAGRAAALEDLDDLGLGSRALDLLGLGRGIGPCDLELLEDGAGDLEQIDDIVARVVDADARPLESGVELLVPLPSAPTRYFTGPSMSKRMSAPLAERPARRSLVVHWARPTPGFLGPDLPLLRCMISSAVKCSSAPE